MKFRWTAILIMTIVLLATAEVNAQKRRKGDKKKESAPAETEAKPAEGKPAEGAPGGNRPPRPGKATTTPTTTTTTTSTTTPAPTTPYAEEEVVDEEVIIVDQPRSASNECPPELKEGGASAGPCTCRDKLDDDALMVECVALTSAHQMHQIFNVIQIPTKMIKR